MKLSFLFALVVRVEQKDIKQKKGEDVGRHANKSNYRVKILTFSLSQILLNIMDKEKALKNLVDAVEVLNFMKLPFWLDAGTCLGAIREKGFIEHDQDIDLGILAESVTTPERLCVLFLHLLKRGFRIYHTFGTLEQGFEVALWRDGIKLDIFWFYRQGDDRVHSAWMNGGRNGETDRIDYKYKAVMVEKKRQIDFLGHTMPVPYYAEEYLITKYGPDWRIPVKNWNWAEGPRNRVK